MRVHFVHRHVQDTVVMLEEGNLPHPRSPRCDMQVPRKALNGSHLGTAQCAKGAEAKAAGRDEDEEELGAGTPRIWTTNGGGFGVSVPRAASDGDV